MNMCCSGPSKCHISFCHFEKFHTFKLFRHFPLCVCVSEIIHACWGFRKENGYYKFFMSKKITPINHYDQVRMLCTEREILEPIRQRAAASCLKDIESQSPFENS